MTGEEREVENKKRTLFVSTDDLWDEEEMASVSEAIASVVPDDVNVMMVSGAEYMDREAVEEYHEQLGELLED